MKKVFRMITIILFFGFLVTMAVITVVAPKKKISEKENKALAIFPEFSVSDIKDKAYMNRIDNYISDHFFMREKWITVRSNSEILSGKREINGVYIIDDKILNVKFSPEQKQIDKNISSINSFAQSLDKPVYVMLVPTSTGIYNELLPSYLPVTDEKNLINNIYDKFNRNNIINIDAYNTLYPVRDEYIYYRTDHHWTSLGAYYAYTNAIRKMGYKPSSLFDFDIEHANNYFNGTLYSKVLYNGVKPDSIDFYHNPQKVQGLSEEVADGNTKTEYPDIYFRKYLDTNDKYAAFTGKNMPEVTLRSKVATNEKILVIKDSFANSFVPFLTSHFSEIKMIDLRYISGYLDKYVNVKDYDKVLILYNIDGFSQDKNLVKLNPSNK